MHFTAPRSKVQRLPNMRIGNTPLLVEETTKFLGLWHSHLSFKKHISVLKTQCKEALNLMRVVAHLKWGGDRDTLLMLYRAIVRSELDYGGIVYGTALNTNLRQLDSIHNSGLRHSLDTIERHLQQAVNAIQEWATRNGFRFAAHKCKVIHFTAPRSRVQRPPIVRIGNTFLPVEESTNFLGLWWDSHLSFKKHICVLKTKCKEALNLIRVVAHLKWGGDINTLWMLYRAIVRSKFDYGCIVYGTASNTNLQHLDSIHNSGLRLALGAFCTSPVSSLYTEANEAPLEERRLKLSMHYYVKTRACIDNPAHHALHEFNRTTRVLYAPRPNGRGGKTRPRPLPLVSK